MSISPESIHDEILNILKIISEDCPFFADWFKDVEINHIQRTDRKKGSLRDVFVIELSRAPSALDIEGSWMKSDLQGQIKGYLIAKLGLSSSIDVRFQIKSSSEKIIDLRGHKFISLEDALKANLITEKSPFFYYKNKYSLDYLELENYRILGPDIGAIEILEKVLSLYEFKQATDFFIGTGALSLVCLMNGVKNIVGYDLDISNAKRTLNQFTDRTVLMEEDTFNADIFGPIELAIADPTIPLCLRFINEILPKICNSIKLLLLVHGHCEHTLWNKNIRNKLNSLFNNVLCCSSLAMELSVCSNKKDIYSKFEMLKVK